MTALCLLTRSFGSTTTNRIMEVTAFHSTTTRNLPDRSYTLLSVLLSSKSPQHPPRTNSYSSGSYSIGPTKRIVACSTLLHETSINGSDDKNQSYDKNDKSDEIVARRIIVKGDVQGGYYRSCVLNEAGKFRRLVGTMSPIDASTDEAEIYVEGKLRMVEGFIRWCQRSNVGLNQIISVKDVYVEEPTGMYDDFYAPVTTSN